MWGVFYSYKKSKFDRITAYIFFKILGIFFSSLIVVGVFIFAFICFKYDYLLNIKAKTIHMQKPLLLEDNTIKRLAFTENKHYEGLILKELHLRQFAYKNTSIKTGESFFDDSDMVSDYYLVVIYDKKLNTPLLSARYYYNKAIIAKCLTGENSYKVHENISNDLKKEAMFLLDRLSGNIYSSIYRKYRDYIFMLLYTEIFVQNIDSKFILMARKEKYDKLLKKYLQIGCNIIGENIHKGKEHWILIGNVNTCKGKLKLKSLMKIILGLKKLKKIVC